MPERTCGINEDGLFDCRLENGMAREHNMKITNKYLETLKVRQITHIAAMNNVKKYSGMKKEDLIDYVPFYIKYANTVEKNFPNYKKVIRDSWRFEGKKPTSTRIDTELAEIIHMRWTDRDDYIKEGVPAYKHWTADFIKDDWKFWRDDHYNW